MNSNNFFTRVILLITAITCNFALWADGPGKYNTSTCFAEEFLRKPNSGCVGIFAASEISYTPLNDYLTGGMFDAMFPSPGLIFNFANHNNSTISTTKLGEILDLGLANLNMGYSNNSNYVKYTKEIFHLFGDPSMRIYTEMPSSFTNYTVERSHDSISVNFSQEDIGNDNEESICFYDLLTKEVNNCRLHNVTFQTDHPNYIMISMSGKDRKTEIVYPPCIQEDNFYIQNCYLNGDFNIEANKQ